HFFKPVPASKIVEIVVGSRPDRVVVDAARAHPAVVRRVPGRTTAGPGVRLSPDQSTVTGCRTTASNR
ncbi:hypothetical protein ACWFRZ_36055, partial [Streptomyces sp. NPDC055097]